ncbi:predicted protein [Chaetoceros tenuissimus]|uniref:Uncharacterized protein n=1 Tax=Chaetoceros tenuissimus TaxID=426638 RepID=A0AAD3H054_9STRA|nr:predicted protein [Chaetoceros tenuissimus]
MSAREYFAPRGIGAIMKSTYLSKSESMETLFQLMESNNTFKKIANLLKIDRKDLQRLQEGFAMLEKSIDQYHFCEDGRNSKMLLKNYERYEQVNLETIEKCLKEQLPFFAESVERKINAKDVTVPIEDEDHNKNKETFEEMYSILLKLYSFVTFNFKVPSLINAVNAHSTELLEICSLIENIPGNTLKKGKYPFTENEELIQARKRRDTWMEKYPSMVMNRLKKIQSSKGTKKRSYTW